MSATAMNTARDADLQRARAAWAAGAVSQTRKILDRHLSRQGRDAPALHLRAVVALRDSEVARAVELLEQASTLEPSDADIWCDYGTALHSHGKLEQAQQAYLRALDIRPDHLDAVFNLANVLRECKQLQQALQFYSALLEKNPSYRYGWNNTGLTLLELRHFEQARRCFEREIELNPGNAGAYANLGHVLREQGQLAAAVEVFRRGLAIAPRYPELHLNMGSALAAQSQTSEAIKHLREAIRLRPNYDAAHQSLVFTLDFDVDTTTRTQQEARRNWYRQCVTPLGIRPSECFRPPDPERRLRLGYISADFRHTSAAMCFLPVLEHFDPQQFEVYCYANSVLADALTERIQTKVNAFRVIAGMPDERAAQLIASDRIDILVDLSGHMRGNRLCVFAHRPAPIQLTAWGYANGTGMPEMDYLLADSVYLPDQDLVHFSERRLDVPAVIPYQAPMQLPLLPANRSGAVRFGCFTRWQKITVFTVRLWSAVLKAVPDSELVLKASQDIDTAGVEAMRQRFEAHGIEATRICFLPKAGWQEHMTSFGEIDIQLDPSPHGGGISLLDGLAMGVPSITLTGKTSAGRLGTALLIAASQADGWVAESKEEYVALAQRWSAAIDVVRASRNEVRTRLLNCAVGDARVYSDVVHKAYRSAWQARVPAMRQAAESALDKVRAALAKADARSQRERIAALMAGCPTDPEILDLASVAALQSDQLDEALRLAQSALTHDPRRAGTWINLGAIFARLRRFAEALRALEKSVEMDPLSATGFYNLGCAHLSLGQDGEAKQAFEETLRLQPDHALAQNNIGIVHERSGDAARAEACFRQAIVLDKRLAMAYGNLGKSCIERGELEEAIANFESALRLDPELHWLRFELAVWYERLGYGNRQAALCQAGFQPEKIRIGGRCDQRVFERIITFVRDRFRITGKSTEALQELYGEISGRLMEIDHPAKNLLLDAIIDLNPDDLATYVQSGISLHHDGRYNDAARRWTQGLERRDAAAARAGVLDVPHRAMDTSWCMALGHLQMFDIYQKSIELGLRPRRDLWLLRSALQKIPNETYLAYWKHSVHIDAPIEGADNSAAIARACGIPREHLAYIRDDFFADRIPGVHALWHMEFASRIQRDWEARGGQPLLRLSDADRVFGESCLVSMGVPPDAWYVCLHVREPGFWGKWDRHHPSLRNAHIDAYTQAIDQIVERGGWVIRMGDKTMKPLAPRERVVDYAHSPLKSDRMDVFLFGSARLFIGVNSGAALIPPTFGVPCLLTNFVPIGVPFPYGGDRMLPKLFRQRESGKLLSFDQMFTQGVANAQFVKHVSGQLEVLDNEPEDIARATAEMLGASAGEQSAGRLAEFATLRARYEAILVRHNSFTGSPPAGSFLERYAELLG